jgi:hypothetical protein
MFNLNILNVEEHVFYDQKLKSKLEDFNDIFDQWRLSKVLNLKPLRQKSLLDLLNSLKSEHIKIIEEHLGKNISITSIDPKIVKNCETHIDHADIDLCRQSEGFNVSTYRKGNQLYISYWR